MLAACHAAVPAGTSSNALADNGAVPAVLVDASATTRQALAQAMNQLMQHPTLLADDAFVHASRITLEPALQRGRPVLGRDTGLPQAVHLLLAQGQCWLQHEPGQRRVPLGQGVALCKPAASQAHRS